jgi:hypothetical protein
VFFAVVDRITHTRFIQNPWVQRVSDALLYVVTFSFLGPLVAGAIFALGVAMRRLRPRITRTK